MLMRRDEMGTALCVRSRDVTRENPMKWWSVVKQTETRTRRTCVFEKTRYDKILVFDCETTLDENKQGKRKKKTRERRDEVRFLRDFLVGRLHTRRPADLSRKAWVVSTIGTGNFSHTRDSRSRQVISRNVPAYVIMCSRIVAKSRIIPSLLLRTSWCFVCRLGKKTADLFCCAIGGTLNSERDVDGAVMTLGDYDQESWLCKRWDKERHMRHTLVIR